MPLGEVRIDVSLDEAHLLASKTALAILAGLEQELGDLDRITGWARVFGMVNSAPGLNRQPALVNGLADVILEVFSLDVGRHARSAVGMADLLFRIAVEIESAVLVLLDSKFAA